MAQFQVVCVDTAPTLYGNHRHITHLGLSTTEGIRRYTKEWVIAELRKPAGHRFYTVSRSTGQAAWVIEAGCEFCGTKPYVRTTADGVRDNNLMNLAACPIGA